MHETRSANLSVLVVSWYELLSGDTCTNIMTLACPDRLSASSCVSLLSRNGTCLLLAASAAMTLPREVSDVLMWLASTRRSPAPA